MTTKLAIICCLAILPAVFSITWVPASNGNIVPGALQEGTGADGEKYYVIRANHTVGGWLPGRLVPSQKKAFITYGGVELEYSDYQVLTECNPDWREMSGSGYNNIALRVSKVQKDGVDHYICIARIQLQDGRYLVGKNDQSHNGAFMPIDGKEVYFEEFEVLRCNVGKWDPNDIGPHP